MYRKILRMSGRRVGSLPPVNVLPLRRCTVVGFGCEVCFTTKFNENVEITALAIISAPEVPPDCPNQTSDLVLTAQAKWGLHPRNCLYSLIMIRCSNC